MEKEATRETELDFMQYPDSGPPRWRAAFSFQGGIQMPKKKKKEWVCIAEREFDGDILITDPCYVNLREVGIQIDWDSREAWIKKRGLFNTTYYGDWGCTVYTVEPDSRVGYIGPDSEYVGKFCADAGLVCVLDMRDARKISPDIDGWIAGHEWCATIIKGFRGRVRLMTQTSKKWYVYEGTRKYYDDTELRVRGDGTVDGKPFGFESMQTSL